MRTTKKKENLHVRENMRNEALRASASSIPYKHGRQRGPEKKRLAASVAHLRPDSIVFIGVRTSHPVGVGGDSDESGVINSA